MDARPQNIPLEAKPPLEIQFKHEHNALHSNTFQRVSVTHFTQKRFTNSRIHSILWRKKQLFTQAFPFPIQVALRTCQPLRQAPWRVLPGARHARDSACSKKSGLFRTTASQKSPSMDKSTQLKADVKHGMLNHNLSTWKVLLNQTIPLGGYRNIWSTKSIQILPSVWAIDQSWHWKFGPKGPVPRLTW